MQPSSTRRRSPTSSAPQKICAAAPERLLVCQRPLTHPHSPFPFCPSLAVLEATASDTRAPPRSPPSSRRRRSLTWGAPPPECLLLCQCPLTVPILPLARSLYNNGIGDVGASALAAILKETQITNLKCAAARAFAFVSMPIDPPACSHRTHTLCPSFAVSATTALARKGLPSSRRC